MPRSRPLAAVAAVVVSIVLAIYLAYSTTLASSSTVAENKARRSAAPLLLDHPLRSPSNHSWNATGFHERITYVGNDWDGISTSQCYLETRSCNNMTIPSEVFSCRPSEVKIGHVGGCDPGRIDHGTPICCPITATPNWCTWRGGEEQDSKVCNGQCHEGEMTLFSSQYGGTSLSSELTTPLGKCLKGGEKVFCCRSDHWSSFLDNDCRVTGCAESCLAGFDQLGEWWDDSPECIERYWKDWDFWSPTGKHLKTRKLCCPSPSKIIHGCRWAGETDDCSDNECNTDEFELRRSHHGRYNKGCPYGRHRALCCKVAEEPPFLPVEKVNLWPELPPENDLANFDIQYVKKAGDEQRTGNPHTDPFGWIMIDGPPAVFASAKQKRDGSPSSLEFLDCHEAIGEHRQSVRFVCSSEDPETDCDHIMEDGLEGKVIEMPSNCGAGKYAVAHHIGLAANQCLPDHLSHITNKTVLDLTFDYDFGLMKRGAGDVFFRADYDNMGGRAWDSVVMADPISQRDLGKRFWSPNPDAWREKFVDFQTQAMEKNERISSVTFLDKEYEQVLLSSFTDCGEDGPAFADIRASGKVQGRLKVWATLFGVLGPVARIDHANVFTSSEIDASMQLNVSVSGGWKTETMIAELFPEQNMHGFYHPGLISIQPTLKAEVALTADLDMIANYTTYIRSFTRDGDPIIQSWPVEFHTPTGQSDFDAPGNPFNGILGSVRSDGRIEVDLKASLGLHITLNGTDGVTIEKRGVPYGSRRFEVFVGADVIGTNFFRLLSDLRRNVAAWNVSQVVSDIHSSVWNTSGAQTIDRLGIPGWPISSGQTQARRLAQGIWTGLERVAAYGKIRPWPISAPAEKTLFWVPQRFCYAPEPVETLSCDINLCFAASGICQDEDDCGSDDSPDEDPGSKLVRRGGPRECTALVNGRKVKWNSTGYPEPSTLFNQRNNWNQYPQAFDYSNMGDCFDIRLVSRPLSEKTWKKIIVPSVAKHAGFAIEHILEIQTITRFVEFASSGKYQGVRNEPNFKRIPGTFFTTAWVTHRSILNTILGGQQYIPPVYGNHDELMKTTPYKRVMEAVGSRPNRDDFVLLRSDINEVKGRIWSLEVPWNVKNTHKMFDDWLAGKTTANEFVSRLRGVALVFEYLQNDHVVYRFYTVEKHVRQQFQVIESFFPETAGGLTPAWDLFIRDHLRQVFKRGKEWLLGRIAYAQKEIKAKKGSGARAPRQVAEVERVLGQLKQLANEIPDTLPSDPQPSPVAPLR